MTLSEKTRLGHPFRPGAMATRVQNFLLPALPASLILRPALHSEPAGDSPKRPRTERDGKVHRSAALLAPHEPNVSGFSSLQRPKVSARIRRLLWAEQRRRPVEYVLWGWNGGNRDVFSSTCVSVPSRAYVFRVLLLNFSCYRDVYCRLLCVFCLI